MTKAEEDIARTREMIERYCRKKHKAKEGLCPDCQAALEYVAAHRTRCPYGDDKPACGRCKHCCYSPEMRDKMKAVMMANLPHMLLHPIKTMRKMTGKKKK